MIFSRLRTNGRLIWFSALALGAVLACDLGGPPPPAATTPPPAAEATTPPAGPTGVTPTLPGQSSVAPGTIMLDQTTAISKGSRIAMSFDGKAGQVIGLDVTLVSGKPRYDFHLADKFGNFLASFTSDPANLTETLPEFTLPYDGAYQIFLIGADDSGSIEMVVTAGDRATGGGRITEVGKNLGGLASAPRTFHTFYLTLTQGEVVTIAAKANVAGSPDTSLTLFGPDGQYITDADDVHAPDDLDAVVSGFTVPTSGDYVAIVSNKGSEIGAYTLAVSPDTVPPEAQGAPTVVYDTDYPLGLFDASVASVTFDGTIGEVVRIKVSSLTPGVSADLYLFSPFGQTIAFAVSSDKGKNVAVNEAQLPYTGRYRLEIRPTGDGQGTFRIDRLTASDLTGGGVFGANSAESLPGRVTAPSVFHYYQFNARAGDKISLAVYSVSGSGKLEMGFALLGPNGKQIVFADDSDSEFPQDPELKDYVILQNGTYTVIVYSFTPATGTYDLELRRN